MMTPKSLILFGCLAVALFGAGCRGSTNRTTPPTYEPTAWLPPATETPSDTTAPLQELRDALRAFQEAKSYRTEISTMSNANRMTAKLDISNPGRFRGTIESSTSAGGIEVIGVGDTLYARQPSGDWAILSGRDRVSISELTTPSSIGGQIDMTRVLPDEMNVTRTDDRVRGCALYETMTNANTEFATTLRVCVTNGKPSHIDVITKNSTFNATYTNYNELFTIERPSIKR